MTVPYDGGKFDMPIIQTPGMTVKRIPMPDEMIRIEALKSAVEVAGRNSYSGVVLSAAEKFEAYIRGKNHVCEDYHDDQTMFKVREALHMLDEKEYLSVISELQNAGILFRERRP